MKSESINSQNSINPTSKKNEERYRIIEKGSFIILAVFIISFLYSLGLLPRYCHTKGFESIILSLIFSSIFTCLVGLLIGKYHIQQSNSKKEFYK